MTYPKIVSYSANRGNGFPLLRQDGTPDMDILGKLARFPLLSLDVQPWFSEWGVARADVLLTLRRLNPSIKILAYQLFGWWYLGPEVTVAAADTTWARGSWQRTLLETQGHGTANGGGYWVRWENPATEKALTDRLKAVASSRLFNGVFLDFMGPNSTQIRDAMQRCISAVQESGGTDLLVCGNGDGPPKADGGMKEGFPNLLGNDFSTVRAWRLGRPHYTHDWLQSSLSYGTPDAPRSARFALGTSCLFGCLCSYGTDRTPDTVPYDGTFWIPEYDGGGRGTGWLGEPLENPFQVGGISGMWRRMFSGGLVLVNTGISTVNVAVPPGHFRIGGSEVGIATVPAKDALFLVRAL